MSKLGSHFSLFALALLPACATNPDDPVPTPPAPPTSTASGIVEIDNAIQNATVFVDFNGNNLLDAGEPSVASDATGHFMLTWVDDGYATAHTIGAIVTPTSTRVGVTGTYAAVGLTIHLRAPIGSAVISPLTTLVVSEMASDATLTQATAQAKIAGLLTASHLAFSGQPLDVMSDYVSSYKTSADSAQLRYLAEAVTAVVSRSVDYINGAQSYIDSNDASYFDPAVVAMDKQLTTIANGTASFAKLGAAEQADIVQNPGNYPGYFFDTTTLANDIEAALLEAGEELAEALFEEFAQKFVEELTAQCTELAGDLLVTLIEQLI